VAGTAGRRRPAGPRALGAALDVRIVTADESTVDRGVAGLNGLPVARLGVFDPHTHISMPDALYRAKNCSRSARSATAARAACTTSACCAPSTTSRVSRRERQPLLARRSPS
jgi:hypothetical protein